jgi:hypothetical protein
MTNITAAIIIIIAKSCTIRSLEGGSDKLDEAETKCWSKKADQLFNGNYTGTHYN